MGRRRKSQRPKGTGWRSPVAVVGVVEAVGPARRTGAAVGAGVDAAEQAAGALALALRGVAARARGHGGIVGSARVDGALVRRRLEAAGGLSETDAAHQLAGHPLERAGAGGHRHVQHFAGRVGPADQDDLPRLAGGEDAPRLGVDHHDARAVRIGTGLHPVEVGGGGGHGGQAGEQGDGSRHNKDLLHGSRPL